MCGCYLTRVFFGDWPTSPTISIIVEMYLNHFKAMKVTNKKKKGRSSTILESDYLPKLQLN